MPQINLLPWREEKRQLRQNQFFAAIGGSVLLAGLAVWVANWIWEGKIEAQEARNARLDQEVKILTKAIKEIDDLERQKERLLARMEIIEKLQSSRPEVVHLFDEIVRNVPDGVFLTAVEQSGKSVKIEGRAQSSTRVSAFLRNIDASDWFTDPELGKISTGKRSTDDFNFEFTAKQVTPSSDDAGDSA